MESCARVIETAPRTRWKLFRVRFTSTRSICGQRETCSKQGIAYGFIFRAVTSQGSTGTSTRASPSLPRRTRKSLIKLFTTEQIILRHSCFRSSRVIKFQRVEFAQKWLMAAPKARNMIARGKREAQRNASPLVPRKDFEGALKVRNINVNYFALSELADRCVRLPGATRLTLFGACPRLSYSASSALLGFQIARPSALPGFHIARLWRSAPKNILAILQPRVLYTVVHVSSKHKQTIQKFRAAQKFWTVRLRRQQTSRGVRI